MRRRGIICSVGARWQNGHWQSGNGKKGYIGEFYHDPYLGTAFKGPVTWKKFNFGDAVNINKTFNVEMVRTQYEDMNMPIEYVGVGIRRLQHVFPDEVYPEKRVDKEGGYYLIKPSGSTKYTRMYSVWEYDNNDVRQGLWFIPVPLLSVEDDLEITTRNAWSSNLNIRDTFNLNYTASRVVGVGGIYNVNIEHYIYENGSYSRTEWIQEPVPTWNGVDNAGTIKIVPNPLIVTNPVNPSGGNVKMISGGGQALLDTWPYNFNIALQLNIPQLDISGAPIYSNFVSMIEPRGTVELTVNLYTNTLIVGESDGFRIKAYLT